MQVTMVTFIEKDNSLTMGEYSTKGGNIKQIMFLTMPARKTQDGLAGKGVKPSKRKSLRCASRAGNQSKV